MPHLIYFINCSLDGYTEDASGSFDWSEPDAETHQFINDLIRDARVYLYGRKMYETMQVWETDPALFEGDPITRDFSQIWQAAEKIVYSTTLTDVVTRKTRIERVFDPAAVRQRKASAAGDVWIGGPDLAAHALRAGLVDEYQLMVAPIAVGGGKPALPIGLRLKLRLLEERRFANGNLYLRYQTLPEP